MDEDIFLSSIIFILRVISSLIILSMIIFKLFTLLIIKSKYRIEF